MKRYLFIAEGIYPIVAFADSREAMRAYVRDTLGYSYGCPLPRHAIVSIAS